MAAKASGKKGAKPPSPLKTQTFMAVRSEASEVRREESKAADAKQALKEKKQLERMRGHV